MTTEIPFIVSFLTIATNLTGVSLVWFGFYRAAQRADLADGHRRRLVTVVSLFLGTWVVLAYALGWSGFFAPGNGEPGVPNIVYTVIPLLTGLGFLRFWPAFRHVLEAAPPQWIIGLQVTRILGFLFVVMGVQGLMPDVFATPAGWGDTITGVATPFVAYFIATGKRWARPVAVIWNLFGMADLITAVTLGVLSSPNMLQRLALDTPNTLITTFPVVLIPALAVPLMMLLHNYSLYQLSRRPERVSGGVARERMFDRFGA